MHPLQQVSGEELRSRGEQVNVCIINGGRKVRTGSEDHHKKKIIKRPATEIFEPSLMQIIIGTSKSLVQNHFSRNLSSSNFKSEH